MSRLQNKCLIATAGGHLLLVLIVVFGAAFFVSQPKVDESQILEIVSLNTTDLPFNQGVKGAQPPPPAPVPTPPQPVPQPPQPPQPQPEPPQKTLIEKVQEIFKPEPVKPQPDDLNSDEPADKPTKPAPKKIQINLTPVVRKNTPTTKPTDTSEADERREAQRVRDQKAKAFSRAFSSISKNTSTATEVDMPGAGTAAYSNFKDALATIYYNAWAPPDDTSNDDAITKVRITIARDGTILSARIIGPSGDSRVDASVQRTIDRVTSVPPLPEGKESQRTVTLNFNLKTKRMTG